MKPVILHREAEAEVRATVAYYEGQRDGLGDEFRDEVEEAIDFIARTPQACSPYGNEGLRKKILDRFPYTIYFAEFDECLWVAAVAHHKRRPGYWANRTAE